MEMRLRYTVVGKGATGFQFLKPIFQYNYERSKSSKNSLFLSLSPTFIQAGNYNLCCQLSSTKMFKVWALSILLS